MEWFSVADSKVIFQTPPLEFFHILVGFVFHPTELLKALVTHKELEREDGYVTGHPTIAHIHIYIRKLRLTQANM